MHSLKAYGNTRIKQLSDAGDLRRAVDSNFDAIKPNMLEEGFAEADLEMARSKIYNINEDQGWY